MESQNWTYRAELIEVVDGDTVDLRVDLGFKTYKEIRVRLNNVDTAEIFGVEHGSEEYKTGTDQKKFVEEMLTTDEKWGLLFSSQEESGKYGRWIGDIKPVESDETVTEALLEQWPETESR